MCGKSVRKVDNGLTTKKKRVSARAESFCDPLSKFNTGAVVGRATRLGRPRTRVGPDQIGPLLDALGCLYKTRLDSSGAFLSVGETGRSLGAESRPIGSRSKSLLSPLDVTKGLRMTSFPDSRRRGAKGDPRSGTPETL